ncbi:phosphoribosylpyrophosphate synthetase [Neolewinella agarilytica]|uniref:Phosphoribosylpyrophosphate synthetase n=1 Tax=Neolewinella agarilytica TaxID=478744 RepID=A0A1H9AED1_9BACT|nr:phosphoribosylpyrophosphate synthetase [Neolewinella agarilytica]SEP75064.1 hypothetical protein SAMN05444359_10267 [Neolewinella agarilytica]
MAILQKTHYASLTDAIEELRKEGYEHDFNQHGEYLECKKLEKKFNPENFTIVQTHRFEGMSSTGDNSVLYAIEADDGTKGMLVDAYGVYADSLSPEMIEKFRVQYK